MSSRYSQGKYSIQNPDKFVGTQQPFARSSWEMAFMRFCDSHPNITKWASENVKIPYRHPFTGKIDNSFSPFLTARFGPVFILDGEDEGDFSERWSKPNFEYSMGSFLGLGIDFRYIQKSVLSTMIGYELLPPDPSDDNASRHSGILIHLSFNRNLK